MTMAADLQLWHPGFLSSAKGRLLWRHVNTLNAPVTSSQWLDNGAAIADVYELVFTKSGGVVYVTVDALIHPARNPYRDMSGSRVVTADGTTAHDNVVPGVRLVFAAGTDTGWKARVAVGNFLNDDGSYTPFFSAGIVDEGTATTGQRVAVKNVGSDPAGACMLVSLPGLHWTGTGGTAIVKSIRPHTNTARHKMAVPGTYTITFSDWKNAPSGSGKKSCDILVNGNVAVQDAELDGATVYQYGVAGYDDGADRLRGLGIVLQDTTADPTGTSITLRVAASGYTYHQFAPDSGGTPGAYAYQDLILTEPGQPSGLITAGGTAYFWHRFAVPEGAGPGPLRESTPRAVYRSI